MLSSAVFSVISTAVLMTWGIIPSIYFFVLMVGISILGLNSRIALTMNLFFGSCQGIIAIFYAPLLGFSLAYTSLPPKPIATIILSIVVGILGGLLKWTDYKVDKMEAFKNLFIMIPLIICLWLNKSLLGYDEVFLTITLFSLTLLVSQIIPSIGVKRMGNKVSGSILLALLVLGSCNFLPIDKNVQSVGLVKGHAVWATDEQSYNTKDWTLKANYSYSEFSQVLSRKYKYQEINLNDNLARLLDSDVIILMTPTVPFNSVEKERIHDYVSAGGKLLIIADHTDLYGHARVINDLVRGWGLYVNYDVVFSPDTWYGTVAFEHSRITTARPLSGSSLRVLKPTAVMAWSHNWVSERPDYTAPNFFDSMTWTGDDNYGDWPMAATTKVGSGYVTIWTDSTMFSNFALYQPNVLSVLQLLIEKGGFQASLVKYSSYLIPVIVAAFLIYRREMWHRLIIIFFIIMVAAGGSYLWYPIDVNGFYKGVTRAKVFGKEEYFREPIPNHAPKDGAVSNLYSNLPRFGIYPEWNSEKPDKCEQYEKCVWFVSYRDFQQNTATIPEFVIVVDNNDGLKKLGYVPRLPFRDKNQLGIGNDERIRDVWHFNNSYSISKGDYRLFAANNVVTDNAVGDWWATTDVSPYRKAMIESFANWIVFKRDIKLFQYPTPGIVHGLRNYKIIKKSGKNIFFRDIDFVPYEYDSNYVYLGGGLWGLIKLDTEGRPFLISGPETSDNYLKYGRNRILIVSEP